MTILAGVQADASADAGLVAHALEDAALSDEQGRTLCGHPVRVLTLVRSIPWTAVSSAVRCSPCTRAARRSA